MKITRPFSIATLLLVLSAGLQAQPACSVRSAATAPTLVELYTSEGCNSCPPADRWLSSLKNSRPDVLAAAFHVDYWDRLGWKDRFASAVYTERQQQTQAHSGARFSYTPQIIVNGRDWRGSSLPEASRAAATISLSLHRESADKVKIEAHPLAGAPGRIQLWWAVLEDGHVSNVKAGENQGVTLRHDDVVRSYALLSAANADQQLTVKFEAKGEKPRRLVVVATDPANGQVLQAVELGC